MSYDFIKDIIISTTLSSYYFQVIIITSQSFKMF
jgi:hypothetical protein